MKTPEEQLEAVISLARGGKLARFLASPSKYFQAMLFSKVQYPVSHKSSLRKADLFWGDQMDVLLPAALDIYITGGKTHDSELRLARFLIQSLQHGSRFLDIGAHFGYFSLLAGHLVGKQGKVFALEAASGTYEVLQRNISSYENIHAYHMAVSHVEEEVTFNEFPVLYSEYNSMVIDKHEKERWVKKYPPVAKIVHAITIDSFINKYNFVPDIIKIDVEGAEDKVVSGGINTWQSHNPFIVMEYLEGDEQQYEQAKNILAQQGYNSYVIEKNGSLMPVKDIPEYMARSMSDSENIVFSKG